jgi:N-acetyl-alpha-D-glucosaminyl L-malate synthase BshA
VIPNFIDPDVFDRARYADSVRDQVGRNRKIVMHVSNFRKVKRVRDVVRIFARATRNIDAALVMVGDGPDRVDAQDEANHLGVAERVFFLGKLESVAPLLACADLFLLPSDSESFGLSALEALASGVPVVASNAGGLPEVVRHSETGFLFAPGQVEEMGDAATQILADPQLWSRMSELAARDARERYSAGAIVGQYENLYMRAAGGDAPISISR